MASLFTRYPGAQPFRDTELSRRTFFGREKDSVALADQILVNRLVIVYAKSGLGKSSLLNAGVAPRLRDADSLPLIVRLNETQRDLLSSVIDGVREEAERQRIEFVQGDTASLWTFFKSSEFWRGDLLLKPVLILDQFEELFTLQSEEARDQFLSELSYLVRGIAPPVLAKLNLHFSSTPPTAHVVMSLREDFLGLLEEAADRIPQIMDHRFRVAPLTVAAAKNAVLCPAALDIPNLETKPFGLEPAFVDSIMDYLTESSSPKERLRSPQIEPFHLQLICQRIEQLAAFKQKAGNEKPILTANEFGGVHSLSETLRTFYEDAVGSLSDRSSRRVARRLCEQYLISPEGRRLSIDERELQRQLGLSQSTLRELTERRLLRTDRRSESTYYELSHDTLVQPVLASRRTQAIVLSWTTLISGGMLALLTVFFSCVVAYVFLSNKADSSERLGAAIISPMLLALGTLGIFWLRAGARRRRRYARRASRDASQPLPARLPFKRRIVQWFALLGASGVFTLFALGLLISCVSLLSLAFGEANIPNWTDENFLQDVLDRPFLEIHWTIVMVFIALFFSWGWLRHAARRLWPYEFPGRSETLPAAAIAKPRSLLIPSLKLLIGAYGAAITTLSFLTLGKCASNWSGNIPLRLQSVVSVDVLDACTSIRANDWNTDASNVLLWALVLILSLIMSRRGASELGAVLRDTRNVQSVWLKPAATLVTILTVFLIFLLTYSLSPSIRATEAFSKQQQPELARGDPSIPPQPGWVVGDKGMILETTDAHTWRVQNSGASRKLISVFVDLPDSGWAVDNSMAILHTTDGGVHWQKQTAPGATVGALAVTSRTASWSAGETAGGTFKVAASGAQHEVTGAYVSPLVGFTVGSGGSISRTDDAGAHWKQQKSGTDRQLSFVTFATPQSGWAVGDKGVILHTEDGGGNWTRQKSGTLRNLSGVTSISPQSCWVVGRKGTILHSENGGITWNKQYSGVRVDLNAITFISELSGWAVGNYGMILHTTDGGGSWHIQNTGIRAELDAIAFAKPWGSIGVRFQTPPAGTGSKMNRDHRGVMITGIVPGGPAERAGLKPGGAITSVNGSLLNDANEFIAHTAALKPGTDATLGYIRDGKDTTVHVTIEYRAKLYGAPAAQAK